MMIEKTSFEIDRAVLGDYQVLSDTFGWALDVAGTGAQSTEDTILQVTNMNLTIKCTEAEQAKNHFSHQSLGVSQTPSSKSNFSSFSANCDEDNIHNLEDVLKLTWFLDSADKDLFLQQDLIPDGLVWEAVVEENWQAKALKDFPPIGIGPWVLTRNDEAVPDDKIGIKMPAAMAFGSGEHATTSLCLQLFEEVLQERGAPFATGLDMGTGSGILAIGATLLQEKLYQTPLPFLCVDNDEPSVGICAENAKLNGVADQIESLLGDGFDAVSKTYPLIFANILLQPLLAMRGDLVAALAPGGVVILSGFLAAEQTDTLQQAYGQDLTEVAFAVDGAWAAAVYRR